MVAFGPLFSGIVGGMGAAGGLFYFITVRKMFGGDTPMDQNAAWQAKTDEMMAGGWVRSQLGADRAC